MTNEVFERRIAAKCEALQGKVDAMEECRVRFIVAATQFSRSWFVSYTKQLCSREPLRQLTNVRLAALKTEVNELSSHAGEHVEQAFSNIDIWWHLQDFRKSPDIGANAYYTENQKKLTEPFRFALGQLHSVLSRFGFEDGWHEWDSTGMRQLPNGRLRYPDNLDWPAELTQIVSDYAALCKTAEAINAEIIHDAREHQKIQDAERWDRA